MAGAAQTRRPASAASLLRAVSAKRWTLPRRTPAYPVHLPELPHGLQLTDVSFAPDLVCLSGTLPEWRMDVPRTFLEDILNQLSAAGKPINLTRLGRGTNTV